MNKACEVCSGPMPGDKQASARVCSVGCARKRAANRLSETCHVARLNRKCKRCGGDVPEDRKKGSLYCSQTCYRADANERWLGRQASYMRNYLYGMGVEEFGELLASQNGLCAICRTDEPGGKGSWHVDHDHDAGGVRGLLCHHCNVGLGNFKDNPQKLRMAADYLERGTP